MIDCKEVSWEFACHALSVGRAVICNVLPNSLDQELGVPVSFLAIMRVAREDLHFRIAKSKYGITHVLAMVDSNESRYMLKNNPDTRTLSLEEKLSGVEIEDNYSSFSTVLNFKVGEEIYDVVCDDRGHVTFNDATRTKFGNARHSFVVAEYCRRNLDILATKMYLTERRAKEDKALTIPRVFAVKDANEASDAEIARSNYLKESRTAFFRYLDSMLTSEALLGNITASNINSKDLLRVMKPHAEEFEKTKYLDRKLYAGPDYIFEYPYMFKLWYSQALRGRSTK